MRNLVYYVACTIDGFIAREDGTFDCFLSEGEHFDYLFSEFPETLPTHLRDVLKVRGDCRWFDTVLMGRRTYDVGRLEGITSPYTHLRQYVFSRSMPSSPDPDIQIVSSNDALTVVQKLKQEDGLGIWLCGGAELASELFPEIDEIILKVNPIVLGSGIPLFAKGTQPASLGLLESKVFDNGFIINRYRVVR